jgi:hypothetical protein
VAGSRVLTTVELNRALLARQLLLERSAASIPKALERVGGLQTQYAPSGYIGLWSRLRTFRIADLTNAFEDRAAVQATLMRVTIHTVSAADYWLFAAGTRRARQELHLRVTRGELAGVDMEAAADAIRTALSDGPKRQAELLRVLEANGYPRVTWIAVGQWIDLVRVPPSGTWERRRADLYGLAEAWLPRSAATEVDGLRHLVARYLGGFGPATLNDLASWSGVPVTALQPIAEELDLRRFTDERGRVLLDVPDGPLPGADTPAPVRFLPTWDANLLVHARRTLVLPEEYRPRIFHTKAPQSFPTVLVDGAVAGTWRYDDGKVAIAWFERPPAATLDEAEAEAARLAAFHAGA